MQLLEPDPESDLTVTDGGGSAAVEEGGALALTEDVAEYAIVFTTAKTSADYDFTEADVSNTVDVDPLVIVPTMTERTVDGFTLTLDSLPDSANYIFRYRAVVSTV